MYLYIYMYVWITCIHADKGTCALVSACNNCCCSSCTCTFVHRVEVRWHIHIRLELACIYWYRVVVSLAVMLLIHESCLLSIRVSMHILVKRCYYMTTHTCYHITTYAFTYYIPTYIPSPNTLTNYYKYINKYHITRTITCCCNAVLSSWSAPTSSAAGAACSCSSSAALACLKTDLSVHF